MVMAMSSRDEGHSSAEKNDDPGLKPVGFLASLRVHLSYRAQLPIGWAGFRGIAGHATRAMRRIIL
jgi:hypothetical protein